MSILIDKNPGLFDLLELGAIAKKTGLSPMELSAIIDVVCPKGSSTINRHNNGQNH